MYITALPDHHEPGFDEALHFSKFRKHNVIFNTSTTQSRCDNHVGCLSFKTVFSGEEWYGVGSRHVAVRPGQFLILNNDQPYSCRIEKGGEVRTFSIFFKDEFASSIFQDVNRDEEYLLENATLKGESQPEFFQTLYEMNEELSRQLATLKKILESSPYDDWRTDEHLVSLFHQMVVSHKVEYIRSKEVGAIKHSTRMEIFRRLCVAKDFLSSSYGDRIDLTLLSRISCLSVPQLIRQFKVVYQLTPHQYLLEIRLRHAAELSKQSDLPIHEISRRCGFENVSAFCRAFKLRFRVSPKSLRV